VRLGESFCANQRALRRAGGRYLTAGAGCLGVSILLRVCVRQAIEAAQ